MLIKIATIDDIPEIVNCGRISLPIYYAKDDLLEIINKDDYKILIAENDTKFYGYIIFKINLDKKNIHINSIAINPNFRRVKIGTQLINQIKINYINYNITLYVQSSNLNAITFYKNNSFKIIDEVIGYYSNLICNDAYIMTYNNTISQYTPK